VAEVLIVEAILCASSVTFAILAIELKNTIHAILALLLFTVALGLLYLVLGATYAAVFQISIYSAAMTTLFLVAEYVTRR